MTGSIHLWQTAATDNDDADLDGGVDWREGMPSRLVNDSARALMARIAEYIGDITPRRLSTGASNAYAITSTSSPTALVDGHPAEFIAHQTNAGAATLALNSFGAISLRSVTGSSLRPGEIQSGMPVSVRYRQATNEWLIINGAPQLYALYQSLLSGSSFGYSVGDVKLSLASSPAAGFVRLIDTVQALVKTDYPDLNNWVSGQGYPWGSTSTTFNIPPAGGYFLRFGASGSSIDAGGPRTPGTAQAQSLKAHTHTGTTASNGAHTHTVGSVALINVGGGSTQMMNAAGSGATTTSSNGAHTHTFTTNSTGDGTENRPINVTMFADMLASPALVASGLIGAHGFAYKWSTAVNGADPGAGFLAVNNATPASATTLYISNTDAYGASMAATITSWMTSTSTVKGAIKFQKVGVPGTWVTYNVTGAAVDNTTYYAITIAAAGSNGTLAASDNIALQFSAVGAAGAAGPNTGYAFTWDVGTTDADPGTGEVRVDNATIASATYVYISKTNADGASVGARIGEWGDSTNPVKGILRLFSIDNPGNEINFSISGSCVDGTTYWKVPVSGGVQTGSFSAGDVLAGVVERVGNAGAAGSGSGTVTSVGVTMPTEFSVASSPVTTSGTIAVTKATQSANTVYAGPTTGSAAAPTFRAIVNADLPVTGVTASTYDSVTVNAQGVITGGTNPSAGSDGTYAAAKVTISSGRVSSVTEGPAPTYQKFVYTGSAQTWTRPTGCRKIRHRSIGGGGQGGGSGLAISAGAGGGAGAFGEGLLDVTSIATLTITVGNGGSTGAVGAAGESGGTTSIANGATNIITCPGGAGGGLGPTGVTTATRLAVGGAGGGPVSATSSTTFASANYGAPGGHSMRLGTTAASVVSGAGASSQFGGGGPAVGASVSSTGVVTTVSTLGTAATGYGAGGSGCYQISATNTSTHKGGAGSPGLVIIEEFY